MTRLTPQWPPTPIGVLRRAHHGLEVAIERLSSRHAIRLHRWMFGSTHFVLATAEGSGPGGADAGQARADAG
jgi:hypothetical protein